MKRKFKLIKAYPGYEIPCDIEIESESETGYFSENTEFWEEVVEKDYEILSFKHVHGVNLLFKDAYGNFHPRNNFGDVTKPENELSEKSRLDNKFIVIHSVKRLSDGEIFTVGDFVEYPFGKSKNNILHKIILLDNYPSNKTVAKLSMSGIDLRNKIVLCIDHYNLGNVVLQDAKKFKTPLFKTEDGVEIFECDEFYFIAGSDKKFDHPLGTLVASKNATARLALARFSTKEKGEEYIFLNKPSLSIQDLINIQKKTGCVGGFLIQHAEEFIKSKR